MEIQIDMLRRIIYRLLRHRHYWRYVNFSEMAELYTSRLMTIFAANLVNLFAAVYLYKLGYGVAFIALFYAATFLLKVPVSYLAAQYAAFFGPKHGILLANILRIPSLVAFALVPLYGLPALLVFGVLQQISIAIYDLCYMVDFSKVKHSMHAGKELGMMQIVEKTARVGSPLIGGVIASLYSPQVTIVLASVMFLLAAVPLFKTVEPTMTRVPLRMSGFPWRLAMPSLLGQSVVGFDFIISGMAWTLFVTIVIFSGMGDAVYAALGALASLGVLVSMLTALVFGRIVDKNQGKILLTVGIVLNTILHMFRPFVTSVAGVLGVNIVNETATSAYVLPFMRHVFDVADTSGFRITYMMYMEVALNIGAALGCAVLYLCVVSLGVQYGLMATFVMAAVYELLLLVSRRAVR